MVWSNRIKEHFKNKGYIYTKNLDEFYVDVSDLHSGCSKKVKLICDWCKKEYFPQYNNYIQRRNNKMPDLCRSCSNRRQQSIRNWERDNIEKIVAENLEII